MALLISTVFITFAKIFEPFFSQALQPACLSQQSLTEATGDFPFADDAGETGDGIGAARDADVGMFAVRENIIGNDAPAIGLRKLHRWHRSRRFFVEHRSQLGFGNDLLKNRELGAVEMLSLLIGVQMHPEHKIPVCITSRAFGLQ